MSLIDSFFVPCHPIDIHLIDANLFCFQILEAKTEQKI